MATGWCLSPGYNFDSSPERAWAELKDVVADLRERDDLIASEAMRQGAPHRDSAGTSILEYAEAYKTPSVDATIRIDEKAKAVRQLATGVGDDRAMKHHVRRAFCLLVITEMHRRGFEVNLVVA